MYSCFLFFSMIIGALWWVVLLCVSWNNIVPKVLITGGVTGDMLHAEC